MCLSAFLVLRPPTGDRRVLLGQIDPRAPWGDLAALNPARIAPLEGRWMLPACQLLFFESPQEAARRILREQLGSSGIPLEGPSVHSEAYRRPEAAGSDPHWDLHFIFEGRWPSDRPPSGAPWKELAFVDPTSVDPAEFGRGHGDVLALVGLGPRTTAP
jgi:ADP-ribose pyrophosphatase YjhB (NUDIX family)